MTTNLWQLCVKQLVMYFTFIIMFNFHNYGEDSSIFIILYMRKLRLRVYEIICPGGTAVTGKARPSAGVRAPDCCPVWPREQPLGQGRSASVFWASTLRCRARCWQCQNEGGTASALEEFTGWQMNVSAPWLFLVRKMDSLLGTHIGQAPPVAYSKQEMC